MGIDRQRYLTMHEAAERSGYSYRHIQKLAGSGAVKILVLDLGHVIRLVDYQDLQRYIEEKPQRKPHSDKLPVR